MQEPQLKSYRSEMTSSKLTIQGIASDDTNIWINTYIEDDLSHNRSFPEWDDFKAVASRGSLLPLTLMDWFTLIWRGFRGGGDSFGELSAIEARCGLAPGDSGTGCFLTSSRLWGLRGSGLHGSDNLTTFWLLATAKDIFGAVGYLALDLSW